MLRHGARISQPKKTSSSSANRRMTKEEKETRRSLDAGPLGPKSSKLNAPLPTINKAQRDLSAQSSNHDMGLAWNIYVVIMIIVVVIALILNTRSTLVSAPNALIVERVVGVFTGPDPMEWRLSKIPNIEFVIVAARNAVVPGNLLDAGPTVLFNDDGLPITLSTWGRVVDMVNDILFRLSRMRHHGKFVNPSLGQYGLRGGGGGRGDPEDVETACNQDKSIIIDTLQKSPLFQGNQERFLELLVDRERGDLKAKEKYFGFLAKCAPENAEFKRALSGLLNRRPNQHLSSGLSDEVLVVDSSDSDNGSQDPPLAAAVAEPRRSIRLRQVVTPADDAAPDSSVAGTHSKKLRAKKSLKQKKRSKPFSAPKSADARKARDFPAQHKKGKTNAMQKSALAPANHGVSKETNVGGNTEKLLDVVEKIQRRYEEIRDISKEFTAIDYSISNILATSTEISTNVVQGLGNNALFQRLKSANISADTAKKVLRFLYMKMYTAEKQREPKTPEQESFVSTLADHIKKVIIARKKQTDVSHIDANKQVKRDGAWESHVQFGKLVSGTTIGAFIPYILWKEQRLAVNKIIEMFDAKHGAENSDIDETLQIVKDELLAQTVEAGNDEIDQLFDTGDDHEDDHVRIGDGGNSGQGEDENDLEEDEVEVENDNADKRMRQSSDNGGADLLMSLCESGCENREIEESASKRPKATRFIADDPILELVSTISDEAHDEDESPSAPPF